MAAHSRHDGKGTILVVGGDSLIGNAFGWEAKKRGFSVVGTSRRDLSPRNPFFLDLAEDPKHWDLPKCDFRSVILCAAVSSMKACAQQPCLTRRINVAHTIELAKRLADRSEQIIFLSTTAVFDGETPFADIELSTNPVTEYGRQKADAEAALMEMIPKVVIVRFGKVISPDDTLFQGWMRDLRSGKTIQPFYDLVFAPVSLMFAARCLCFLAEHRLSGVVHATGCEDATYAQAAHWLVHRLSGDPTLVQPINGRVRQPTCFFPRHAALSCPSWLAELGLVGLNAMATLNGLEA